MSKEDYLELFVDAGGIDNKFYKNKSFKIGIYHKYKEKYESLDLKIKGLNINQAERMAILYGIWHFKTINNIEKKIIYSDSLNNVNDKKLQNYCKKSKIYLIWIKRSNNKIADNLTKIVKSENISLNKKNFIIREYNKLI